MNLMQNKYLIFPNIKFLDNYVRNITDLSILPDIPDKYFTQAYAKKYEVDDDRLIESISYELYKTTDYWDLLLQLNKITNLSHLPVNYDIILERARLELSKWMKSGELLATKSLTEQYNEVIDILNTGGRVVVTGNIPEQEIVKNKYLEILKNKTDENEKFREIIYLSPADMSELESDLLALKETPKINSELIINKEDI